MLGLWHFPYSISQQPMSVFSTYIIIMLCGGHLWRVQKDRLMTLIPSGHMVSYLFSLQLSQWISVWFFMVLPKWKWSSHWFCSPPPPHLRQCIALFAVAEGWLLLDSGCFICGRRGWLLLDSGCFFLFWHKFFLTLVEKKRIQNCGPSVCKPALDYEVLPWCEVSQ